MVFFNFIKGVTPLLNTQLGNTIVTASNVMQMQTGIFNAVRSGPMSVKYEYTGRLDASSGTVTMGINHFNQTYIDSTTGGTTLENGLMPVAEYSTLQRIEDCPHARTCEITQSLKAINIPVDYNALNLKSPLDANNTILTKRLFLLINGGPVSQKGACRITICSNWEGIPSGSTADFYPLSHSVYPSEMTGKEIFDYMIKENLVYIIFKIT